MKTLRKIICYASPEGLHTFNSWKHYPTEKMLMHVKDVVFPFIQEIRYGEKTLFSEQMKDAVFIYPSHLCCKK